MTELLVFNLAGQQYGLPACDVSEVVPRATLTPLTGAPKNVIGILRLRGALLPIIDLRTAIGLPDAAPRLGQAIIVTRNAPSHIGLLVDGVVGLVAGADIELQAAPSSAAGHLVRHVQETQGRVVTVLDVEAAVGSVPRAYLAAIRGGVRRIDGCASTTPVVTSA